MSLNAPEMFKKKKFPSYFVGRLHSGDVTKCLLVFVPLSNMEDPTKGFFLFSRKLKAIVFAE